MKNKHHSITTSIEDGCACDCETYAWANAVGGSSGYASFNIDCNDPCSTVEHHTVLEDGGSGVRNCKRRIKTKVVRKASDGGVLVESAANMAGATVNENSPGFSKEYFMMAGSTHFQLRNDKNLEIKLKKLYIGDYHKHFILTK